MRIAIKDSDRCVGCQSCMFACTRRQGEGGLAKSCLRVHSVGGMEKGFTVVVCRACDDPPCAKVCPTDALKLRKGGGVTLNQDRCLGCGYCRRACLIKAIFWADDISKPLICIHCGICSKFCPHGVIGMDQKENKE